jgi:hypothetical protein
MPHCAGCGLDKSAFILDNKRVCLRCDDLLFDIEIETDEEKTVSTGESKKTEIKQPTKGSAV